MLCMLLHLWENQKSTHRNTPTWIPVQQRTSLVEINRQIHTSEGINTTTVIFQVLGRVFWYKMKCFLIPFFCLFLANYSNSKIVINWRYLLFLFFILSLSIYYFCHLCPVYDSVETQGVLALISLKSVWSRKLHLKNLKLLLITCIKNILQKGMKGEYALFIIHNAVK